MTPETSKLLAELAAKLGTTVEYLWPKLVGHAQAEATVFFWIFLVASVMLVLLGAVMLFSAIAGDSDEAVAIVGFCCFIMAFCGFLGVASNYADMKFPEAAALKEIVKR